MNKYIHSFKIPRKKWLHGETGYYSCLLRPSDGKRCCIGWFLKSLDFDDEILQDEISAHALKLRGIRIPKIAKWLINYKNTSPTKLANCLYNANDLLLLSDVKEHNLNWEILIGPKTQKAREKAIIEFFAEKNIKVTFTGKY